MIHTIEKFKNHCYLVYKANFLPLFPDTLVVVQLLSHVQLFGTPWTVTHQTPLSMGFLGQEYLGGLPFPSPGDLPDPGIEATSPAMAGSFLFTTELPGKPLRDP